MLWGGVLGIQASPATLAGEASEGSCGEVGSAVQRNTDPTSQPAAPSIIASHSSASCCIVCRQKQGLYWLLDSPCCQILGGRTGIPVLLLVKASLDQYSHVTHQRVRTHAPSSTFVGVTAGLMGSR